MKLRSLKFKSVKSTNDIALMLIKRDNIKPSIILSERQTKGRGTMGKKWISKKGNLFLSIFFDMSKKKIDFKKFAIINAYLIKSILAKKFSNKIKIKWPNDLLFKRKKICGILQETVINAGKQFGYTIPKTILKKLTKRWAFFDKSEIFSLYSPSFFNRYKHEKAPRFITT